MAEYKQNSEYRGTASNVAKKKAATKSKTVATPGTKVSQATINKIKAMGMTKALKGAANASPEMREGLKRLYGAKRVSAAAPSKPVAKSPDAARSSAMKPSKPVARSADAARAAASKPAKPVTKSADAARASVSKVSTIKAPVKKSGTTDPFARAVFNAGGAIKRAVTGGSNQGMTAAQVAAENKRRAAAVAAAKKNK